MIPRAVTFGKLCKTTGSLSGSLIRRGLEKEAKHVMRAGAPLAFATAAPGGTSETESWEWLSPPGSGRSLHPQRRRLRSNTTILSSNHLLYWLTTCLATGRCKSWLLPAIPILLPKDHVVQKIPDRWEKLACVSPTPAPGAGPIHYDQWGLQSLPTWKSHFNFFVFFFLNTNNLSLQTKRWRISRLNTRMAIEIYEIDGCLNFWRNNNRKSRHMSMVGKTILLQGLNSTQDLLSINENESWKKS